MRRAAAISLLMLALAPVPEAAAQTSYDCTGDPSKIERLDLTVGGQPTYGLFAFPSSRPRSLIVFGHGFSFNVDAWRNHIVRHARRDGAVVVAMNYRGLQDLPKDSSGFERSRGYPVKAGSEDLIAAAQHFLGRCGNFPTVSTLGVSMGGNVTGLSLAAKAKRADGRPLFDNWVGVEGAYDLTQLYQLARGLAPTNSFANNAKTDIEAETGGTFEQRPSAYAERTLTNRADDIAASGLKGVTFVHATEDGLAPYTAAQDLTARLRGRGLATDLYTVGRRAPGDDPDTTISSYSGTPTENAGHGPEWSQRHIVLDTGFDRLSALLTGGEPPPCNRNFATDGPSRSSSPDPRVPAAGCSAGNKPAPCVGAKGPKTSVRIRARRQRLRLRGGSTPGACGAKVKTVEVAVTRVGRRGCRYMRASGRLTGTRRCGRRLWLTVPGTDRWALFPRRRLGKGGYRLAARGLDAAGRRGRLNRRRAYVR